MSTENCNVEESQSDRRGEGEGGVEVVVEEKRGEVGKGTGDVWPYCLAWK